MDRQTLQLLELLTEPITVYYLPGSIILLKNFMYIKMWLWNFYCTLPSFKNNKTINCSICVVCKLCHNLNSFVVLYLEFCAWFNMKGELGESLTKQKRYSNWYIFIHLTACLKRTFKQIFLKNPLWNWKVRAKPFFHSFFLYWTREGGSKKSS